MPKLARLTAESRLQSQHAAIKVCSVLLQQRRMLQASGQLTPALSKQLQKHLSICLWHHSEAGGHKFLDARWWSAEALRVYREKGVVTAKTDRDNAHQHEHVFPQNETIAILCALDDPSEEVVSQILVSLNEACVVTAREHRQLPRIGNRENPWLRYSGVAERMDTWMLADSERPG